MRKFSTYLDTFKETRLIFIKKAIKFNIAKKMSESFFKKYILKERLRI